jgi:4-aminobutyrate aminotransferase / (S)-3-amino-2-methylpropionate transaminase / 5-aminovalerate transaminase
MSLNPSVTPGPGSPSVQHQRHLVTEIPGPVSRELLERRQRSMARSLGRVRPVFVTAAGGGIVMDADGNSLIDFGSGIAVTSVGNSAELVVNRVIKQVAQFTTPASWSLGTRGIPDLPEAGPRRTHP